MAEQVAGGAMRMTWCAEHGLVPATSGLRCVCRLIAGNKRKHPVHLIPTPPYSDHSEVFLDKSGIAVAYVMHLYLLQDPQIDALKDYADRQNFRIEVNPDSWYAPLCTAVILWINSADQVRAQQDE